MMQLLIVNYLILISTGSWVNTYSGLFSWDFSNNDGWQKTNGAAAQILNCNTNNMDVIYLDANYPIIIKTFTNLPPHYQAKVQADVYYVDSWDGESGMAYIESTQIISRSYVHSSMNNFYNQCGSFGWNSLTIVTATSTISHTSSSLTLKFQTTLDQAYTDESFDFRNVQLWVNQCHETCASCNGASSSNCLSCYTGSPSGGKCLCTNSNLQFFQPTQGCVQECTRNSYQTSGTTCIYDERISIHFSSFSWGLNVAPTSFAWDLYSNSNLITFKSFSCDGYAFVGKYATNEYIQKQYTPDTTTTYARYKVSYHFFNTRNQYSSVWITFDGVLVDLIYYDNGTFKTLNSKIIVQQSGTCSNLASDKNYVWIRTEQLIKLSNYNPVVVFKSSQDQWALRNVDFDQIVCSTQCATCLDASNCQTCNSGYYLLKGQCVTSCPLHSTVSGSNCIDQSDETQYTSYLLKAFYLETSPETEATDYFSLISSSGTNFIKGVRYSYLRNKRIFGGALTWFSAKFRGTYSISVPHYQVRVKMLVVLGDNFGSGQFQYSINGGTTYTITRSTTANDIHQEWGDTYSEYFYQVDRLISHSSSTLTVDVECIGDTSRAVNQAFCGIANYFITINECPPLCTACTSLTSCSAWISSSNLDSSTHTCKSGYHEDYATRSCVADPICGNGIKEDGEYCDDGNGIEFDGCYECKFSCPTYYPNCPFFGTRTCSSGYYLNQFNNMCYPVCGDNIIAGDEECEDNNLVPFDGCHQCKYQCQESCQTCTKGVCYQCKSGWKLTSSKRCEPICKDGVKEFDEECDDKIYADQNKCDNCKFSCPDACSTCSYGVCQSCQNGFRLNKVTNKCTFIPNDSVITIYEQCDDGNYKPFDTCYQNYNTCQSSCLECNNGKCYKCQSGFSLDLKTRLCTSICGDKLVKENEVCDDNNSLLLDKCYSCEFSCPNKCTTCNYGICQACQQGYYLNSQLNKCQSYCGDKITVDNEECDDGNLIPYDGCHNCKFQCQQSCLQCRNGLCYKCQVGWKLNEQLHRCTSICGDGLITAMEMCEDGIYSLLDVCYQCQFSCPKNCISCLYGKCLTCSKGFSLDQSSNACKEVCGDKEVVGQEECDDGNLIPYDGCHECKYQCQDYCLECRKGKCYRCEQGWLLNKETYRCDSVCGDQYLNRNEVCDESIYQLYDKCESCQFTCPLNCQTCLYGKCSKCQEGFGLDNSTNQCVEICGDGIRVGQEECDDGNLISHDGCYDCKYQCQRSCVECQKGGKCLRCQIGWLLNTRTHLCQPICDDSIQVEVEECDSGPYNLFSNCSSCKLSCSSDCQVCSYGVCKSCKAGFLLDESTNECKSICGDGLITRYEECDDADFRYDNCVNCKLKCQDSCLECVKGKCFGCQQGWEWNKKTYKCDEICGDAILVGSEVCDDNNGSLLDQCYQCQFSCSSDCMRCSYGKCIECQPGYYLHSQTLRCYSIIGDGIVTKYEECDDKNLFVFDGCWNSLFSCQESCLECRNGVCSRCQYGWQLDRINGKCETICGDGIRAGNEVCDDGNTMKYDRCYQCQYYCPWECKLCDLGKCLSCIEGFSLSLIDQRCYPIRSDGFITIWEECDDNNLDPFDSCSVQQYSCGDHCYQCVKGECLTCKSGWVWNQVQKQCESFCGDGIQAGLELCDDGNVNPYDSCFQCKYYCEPNCEICELGWCKKCIFGYELHKVDNQCYPIQLDNIITKSESCEDENLFPFDGCRVNKYNCQEGCDECVEGQCWRCKTGYQWNNVDYSCEIICGDGLIVEYELCDDGNFNVFDGCVKCHFQCPPDCKTCTFQGRCLVCNEGFKLNPNDNICSSVCGDGLIRQDEECDDGKLVAQEGCQSCKYECSEGCLSCYFGKCYGCKAGWSYEKGDCIEVCGDANRVGYELCDDGNTMDYDGCDHCKFQCDKHCAKCEYGKCKQCQNGWYLDKDYACQNQCGDGILVENEWCDDGNDAPLDGCYYCNFLCSMGCIKCDKEKCLECEPPLIVVPIDSSCQIQANCDQSQGWYYDNYDNKCKTKCGDKIKQGAEECDDGNNVQYDGCYECKFSCDEKCALCKSTGCQQCNLGYYLTTTGRCNTSCGDGVLVSVHEQCDDGNNAARDGCTYCKIDPGYECVSQLLNKSLCYKIVENCTEYINGICVGCQSGYFYVDGKCIKCSLICETCESTPKNCDICLFESCTSCELSSGMYTNTTSKQCYSKCGDSITASDEECDDGNNIDNDGCSSQCKTEQLYECGNSGCFQEQIPDASGDWVNSTTENVVSLIYYNNNQTVKFGCENLTIWIEQFTQWEFSFNITDKENCILQFQYYKTIELVNLIHIQIPLLNQTLNRRLFSETNFKEIVLKPRKWVYYSEEQQSISNSVLWINQYLISVTQGVLILSLMSGSTFILWGMLEILFWINYLYLYNIDYPMNLKECLLIFKTEKLLMTQPLYHLNPSSQDSFISPQKHFIEKDINPLFLENCKNYFQLIFIATGFYIISLFVSALIQKFYKSPIQKRRKIQIATFQQNTFREEPQVSNKTTPRFLQIILNFALNYQNNIISTFLKITQVLMLDMSLACILQLTIYGLHSHNTLIIINSYSALITLILLIGLIIMAYIVSQKNSVYYKSKSYQSWFGSFYEGLSNKAIRKNRYNVINLIRKLLFIYFIIQFYDSAFIQCLTSTMTLLLIPISILYGNQFESAKLFILNFIPNLCISIVGLINSVIQANQTLQYFSDQSIFDIGWIAIALIWSAIGIQIIYLFIEVISKIKKIVRPESDKIYS